MNNLKNILFVCSANKDRSKTAEDYFSQNYPGYNFKSAGTNQKICQQLGTNYLTEEALLEADKTYVMENKHLEAILKRFGNHHFRKIEVLNIRDVYNYGDSLLVQEFEKKISL